MLETWKQTFESEGTVEVRMGAPRALVVLVAGLAFVAVGYWMVTASPTDGVLADLGSTGRLVVGLLSLALGLVGVRTSADHGVGPRTRAARRARSRRSTRASWARTWSPFDPGQRAATRP